MDSMQSIFIKKCFLFTVGSVYGVKQITAGSRDVAVVSLMTKSSKRSVEMVETRAKRLFAAGFDELVKRCDKCVNVGGGYVE
jgi:hypothetical protein